MLLFLSAILFSNVEQNISPWDWLSDTGTCCVSSAECPCLITYQDVCRTHDLSHHTSRCVKDKLWGSPTFCFSCNECTPEESPLIHYISAPGVSQCWINSVLMNWILTGLYLFDQFLFPKSTARLAWVSPERISLNRWNCPNFTASIKTSCWEIKP